MLVPFLHWISYKYDVVVFAPRGSAGVDGEASHVAQAGITSGARWAFENAVPSLEIAARACSEPHVRSKSQLGPVPEPTRVECRAS